ncbi:natural resistance-associated macrophage protein [Streptomyces mashuensis]|uniref:Natural resistance-associated macrophage protein n=2 Tax=Streptomyces mashuensis TaxID=33904 RepID=A0A919E9Q9_9ACTN|nr:natural resistance-associated macrophage protein [Streptomyces mashuensis]
MPQTLPPTGDREAVMTDLSTTATAPPASALRTAVLDDAHVGDIRGALGTIKLDDTAPRRGLSAKLKTLLAIVGPGLIVMVGDNDAGAFGTYSQAGQNYGTSLLWTLLLLIPVLYVNQEMVLRLGAVTGVGHARLILERFGKFWGAFSVIDLFLLNALTIVTEFIGITLAVGYLGLPKAPSVLLAAAIVVVAASTGSFRRFERTAILLCAGSLLLIPVYFIAHPSTGRMAHDFVVPGMPHGSQLSDVMLLIIAIVGTTVAPWQLFFQQSYVIDKRITPRFMRYEKADLWLGIVIVVIGAAAMMGFCAAAFGGHGEFGHFTDSGHVAAGLEKYAGKTAGVLFAVALLDASVIGACAVSLSTAYAIGDVMGLKHSLHRGIKGAKGFYAVFAGLILTAAIIVIIPGSPLGLLTEGVQTLAGVLLPSASVFLLLLCNDRTVLGPWVNGRAMNAFTSIVVAVLVTLSVILTAAVLFPGITSTAILDTMAVCGVAGILALGYAETRRRRKGWALAGPVDRMDKENWRMPPLDQLPQPVISTGRKVGLAALRTYLLAAMILVIVRIVQLALGH